MVKELPLKIFQESATTVAYKLLESDIVRKIGNREERMEISEVEIYEGFEDKASHATRGKTKRNEVMFLGGGVFYVYLVYGMHYMLNVVVGEKNYPAAILIRGAGEYDGPGKLTRALKIDKSFDGKKAVKETGLWFEHNGKTGKIAKKPRVGVDYAKEWSEKPLRFIKN